MTTTAFDTHSSTPTVSATMVAPRDRVRWGPIIAGLFAALCTLAVLSVLGVAIGASAYDPGDPVRRFGIGAGIWAAISALVSFFVGGWLAARSLALRGEHNGLLNGAMVWVTAIPVMLYLLGGGLFSTAQTAAQAGSNAADQISRQTTSGASDMAQTASATIGGENQATGSFSAQSTSPQRIDPQTRERAADMTARTAWGVLVSMVLGLAASAVGGYAGARRDHHRDDRHAGHGANEHSHAAHSGGGTSHATM